MDVSKDLLLEIGTEELPPKALKSLRDALQEAMVTGLDQAGIACRTAKAYATPRRLAVYCEDVPIKQADRLLERRGPALASAFDAQGTPTRAALGFAQSCGVEIEALQRLETDKGSWLFYRTQELGRPALELIAPIAEQALKALPIPKRMRWGSLDTEFVRPVHWVVALFGEQLIEAQILGLTTQRETYGHRFHHPGAIVLSQPSDYKTLLEEHGYVQADFEIRCALIRSQVETIAAELGGRAIMDLDLLEEVTALVEWPVPVAGHFDTRFLQVPQEALISTMQGNQKYFPVLDEQGVLMPHFITISNIVSTAPEQVREGNERVVRPRLADAEFFWKQDQQKALAERIDGLRNVTFQQQLGSLHDKSERIARLCAYLANTLGLDATDALRAARLCKCDLQTEMVHEFPELQGIMGRYYAEHDGELPAVSQALYEQYLPRHAGDVLPATQLGRMLAISDRLDTLVGIFAIGQRPSGTKDPFGLRRAALGVLRILIECELDLDLHVLLERVAAELASHVNTDKAATEVLSYMMERLRAYYQDQGIEVGVFEAVLALQPKRPLDFAKRIHAVDQFLTLPEAEALASAHKRIHNILKKEAGHVNPEVDRMYLQEAAEKALYQQLEETSEQALPLFAAGDYVQGLSMLAALRDPVDAFFDQVMVMVDEIKVRNNRLALLQRLSNIFLQVADLSKL